MKKNSLINRILSVILSMALSVGYLPVLRSVAAQPEEQAVPQVNAAAFAPSMSRSSRRKAGRALKSATP